VAEVLTHSQHLLKLIDEVLDLAKVEAGRIDLAPEPLDLAAAVGEVVAAIGPLAARKRITLGTAVAAELGAVVLDPARFRQVLYNYVSNALKFTPEAGHVQIRVQPEGAGWFRVAVEDTGVGIRDEDIPRLFVAFEQLGAAGSELRGTGLGLAFTRRLVEAQGGRVGVTSTPGQGSVFFAVLPWVAAAP
jgi:signal transduction histidine kinase